MGSRVLIGLLATAFSFCCFGKVFAEPVAVSSEAAPEDYQDD
jgi:hypothetical protein